MDRAALTDAYEEILHACDAAELGPNERKLVQPTDQLVAFNCSLEHGRVAVTAERIAKFHADAPNEQSVAAFEMYCGRVASANQ